VRRAALVVTALALAGAATAATPQPQNLLATPAIKAALLSTFTKAHPQYAKRGIVGPEQGRTYYGRYGATEYAVASFDFRRGEIDDQPEVFRRSVGGRWTDTGDTGGDVCPPRIPLPLLRTWKWSCRARASCTA
jgi:hypothetical protein